MVASVVVEGVGVDGVVVSMAVAAVVVVLVVVGWCWMLRVCEVLWWGGVVALVVAVCGGVLCCVLDLLLAGVWLLWSSLFCRWCVGFLGCFGDLLFFVFPCGFSPCGVLRENL